MRLGIMGTRRNDMFKNIFWSASERRLEGTRGRDEGAGDQDPADCGVRASESKTGPRMVYPSCIGKTSAGPCLAWIVREGKNKSNRRSFDSWAARSAVHFAQDGMFSLIADGDSRIWLLRMGTCGGQETPATAGLETGATS